jgi:hypothetical protein
MLGCHDMASPGSWLQLFAMGCCWVWVCKVPAVNVVALKIIDAACKHDMAQRRYN